MFLVAVFGGMGAYIYIMKNKRKNINNSLIHKKAENLIKNSYIAK
jgi:hypothetical protein